MHDLSRWAVLLLLGWGATAAAGAPQGVAGPGVATYTGEISARHNREFFDSVTDTVVTRLVVDSEGGEVAAGIALGLWVFEHRVDVEVSGICLSSCANYVFPAGRRKVIRPGAVVAWHGNYRHLKETGLWQDEVALRVARDGEDRDSAWRRVRAQVDHLVALERDFFEHIGVDEYLCWVGKMPPYRAPNYYFLSRADMARFGLTGLHVPDGYVDTDLSGLPYDIVYLDLGTRVPPR